jgi:N-acylglucosamine-6-phosphate 2-epimerase
MNTILGQLKHGVVVSVQASQGEPLDKPEYLCALAESALNGGACGVRMAQPRNMRYFKEKHPNIPVIGITKPEKIPANAAELVYITPAFEDVASIADCCDIVAMDATLRTRPNGEILSELVARTRKAYPQLLLMADIATLEEGIYAEKLGFDLIGTTLSGYTLESQRADKSKPDFELLSALIQTVRVPVIMEGRLWEPAEVKHAFELGAFAAVIGSAVTRPHEITRRFVNAAPVRSQL